MNNCAKGKGNTGQPNNFCVFDVAKNLILVEYYKEDGTINGVDIENDLAEGVLNQEFLDGKVKHIDPKLRWYVTPEIKNIADERAEDVNESFDDTSLAFIQEGARSFNGIIVKGDPVLLGNLKNWRHKTIGYYYRDKSGNLIGNEKSRDGFFDPILIQNESFSASLVKTTDSTVQKISIKFVVDSSMTDENLVAINSAMITANLAGARGLVDVVSLAATDVSTTGFTVQLNTNFGSATAKIPAEGLEVTDFAVFNVTTSTYVVPTSVDPVTNKPGKYAFVFAAQTASDVLLVTNPITGTLIKGYDLTKFNVEIPV